jgi:hypothetical protein
VEMFNFSGEIYTKRNRIRNGTLDLVLVLISTFAGQKNMNKKERSSLEQSVLNDVNDSKQNHNYKENRTKYISAGGTCILLYVV